MHAEHENGGGNRLVLMPWIWLLALSVLPVAGPGAAAETVFLQNGRTIDADKVEIVGDTVRIQKPAETIELNRSEVLSIRFVLHTDSLARPRRRVSRCDAADERQGPAGDRKTTGEEWRALTRAACVGRRFDSAAPASQDALQGIPRTIPSLITPPPGCRAHPHCSKTTDICR